MDDVHPSSCILLSKPRHSEAAASLTPLQAAEVDFLRTGPGEPRAFLQIERSACLRGITYGLLRYVQFQNFPADKGEQ
jgi:hypothetical protein